MKDSCEKADHSDTDDLEIAEYSIGGYRFGVQKHRIVDFDTWYPNYLKPVRCEDEAVLGTMLYRGEPIFTIDLRLLFFPDHEPTIAAAPFYTVVKYEETLFTILHDGFLGICEAPLQRIKLFKSLYVLGVKWLSGVIIFDDYLVIVLSLEALSNMFITVEDRPHPEILLHPISDLLLE
jgi:chemotaxis signal transduction protein